MSTAIHTPSHSPISKQDLFAYRSTINQDSSFHPAFSPAHRVATPPCKQQPLLLTPSPLRRKVLNDIDFDSAMHLDFEEFASAATFSTPFHPNHISSPKRTRFNIQGEPPAFSRPATSADDDDEGSFLRSGAAHTSLPLQTPERLRFDLGPVPNTVSNPNFSHAPKRKIQHMESSPSRRGMTPLHIRHESEVDASSKRFATLAPLPAPKFLQSRPSLGNNMGRHVASLKNMRISDRSMDIDIDSDSDEDFSTFKSRRSTMHQTRPSDSSVKEEVIISPDGHINKRRTRSRPVSLELLRASPITRSPKPRVRERAKQVHHRNSSNTSVSETGSPVRTTNASNPPVPRFNRLASSATLFFGPAINNPGSSSRSGIRPKLEQVMTDVAPPSTPIKTDDDPFSPLSPDDSFTNAFPKAADTSLSFAFSVTQEGASPRQRIPTKFKKLRDSGVVLSDDGSDDEINPDVSQGDFLRPYSLHSRSSTYPASSTGSLATESTAFDESFTTPSHEASRQSYWADSSHDVSVVDEFIVKTLEAGTKDTSITEKKPPGTPQKKTKTAFLGLPVRRPWASAFTSKLDRSPLFGSKLPSPNFGTITDSGGSAGDLSVPRRTTRAKAKPPRKSCPVNMQFQSFDEQAPIGLRDSNGGAFVLGDADTSPTEAHLNNPRLRTYGDVGMGRPSAPLNGPQLLLRRSSSGAFSTISTMSNESDTVNFGTPTRKKDSGEFCVPMVPLKPHQTPSRNLSRNLSPLFNEAASAKHLARQLPGASRRLKENRRPDTMYSVSPVPALREPKTRLQKARASEEHFVNRHLLSPSSKCEDEGRFESEFVEVEKIGSGEFGTAMKVRYKDEKKGANRVLAIKKSKRLEGARHRTRLLEEVDVLKHLSSNGRSIHPNILGYIDSWEQDGHLFILTELCDFGNFAHFLAEYGLHFARLEEARVWKIFADISSGLHFMHQSHVVHFDLKPANIFITAAGRFKIGDFGMSSFWPRRMTRDDGAINSKGRLSGFEREGDKMYLAAEVLQGRYGPETDIFSFGMVMLETATNIVVPAQGELWHKLREEDFSPVEGVEECSSALISLIASMMRKNASQRPSANNIFHHPVISRARTRMQQALDELHQLGARPEDLFRASPLAGTNEGFLDEILGRDSEAMDCDF